MKELNNKMFMNIYVRKVAYRLYVINKYNYVDTLHTYVYMYLCTMHSYAIMRNCWGFKPEDRPSFADLVKDISQQLEVQRQVKQLQEYPSTSYLKLHN